MTHRTRHSQSERRGDVTTVLIGVFVFICAVFLMMLLSFGGAHRFRMHREEVEPRAESAAERDVLVEKLSQSTEHLWEKLTEARIDLGGETASDGAAPPEEKSRPAWVDQTPTRVGDVYRRVVSSDPFTTIDECYRQLEQKFVGEVRARLQTLLENDVPADSAVPVGIEHIMREICHEEFTETVDASFGEMQRVHVLMEFTPAVDRQLRESWETDQRQRQSEQRQQRIVGIGLGFAAVLGMLMLIYGLLRFDTWTRGYYTRRLIVAVPVAIILLVVLLSS